MQGGAFFRRFVRAGAIAAAVLVVAVPSWASTFVLMSDAQLAAAAHGAWVATVVAVESGIAPSGGIHTYVTLTADGRLSGPAEVPDRITLRELGGRVGDTEVVAYGAPRFTVGERVLVFFEQAADGTLRTYQQAMGKFRLERDAASGEMLVVRGWGANPDRVNIADPSTGTVSPAAADSRSLSEMLATVAQATAGGTPPLLRPVVARPAELDQIQTVEAASTSFAYLGLPSRTTAFPSSLVFSVDATPPATIGGHAAALQAAMSAWEHSTNNISLAAAPATEITQGYNGCGGNRIVNEDPASELSNPSNCAGMLAVGGYCSQGIHTGPRGETFKTIVSSKVVFADGWGGCNLWNVDNYTELAAHEIGHGLGFGHSANLNTPDISLAEAVMNWSCCNGRGNDPNNLASQDDLLMAAHAYPSGEKVAYYLLDGFGGLHPGDGAVMPVGLPPYFGFDIARDFAMTGPAMGLVLDGLGGVHAFGGEPAPTGLPPYFGFDVAEAIAVVPGTNKFYVVDAYGGMYGGNGAAPAPGTPYFGFDIMRDVEAVGDGAVYVLDGFGGVHAGGSAAAILPIAPFFGFDIARAIVLVEAGDRYYVVDGFGGVHRAGYPATIAPAAPYFGADVVVDAALSADDAAFLVIDAYGGVHPGGGAGTPGNTTPYFGFDIVRAARAAK